MSRQSFADLSQAQMNRIWSSIILEEAARFGAEHVCLAPGSRSTPLALESIKQTNLTLHTHFDERGLGFFALGLAKASQKPVIVIVTSGTAVANLLPAVVEANLTGEKLILLTADRPPELVGVGANQAIVQQGIFSSHVTQSILLPSPTSTIDARWLLSKIDNALHNQAKMNGPIHLNCPFPEPLYIEDCPLLSEVKELPLAWLQSNRPYTQAPNTQALNTQAPVLEDSSDHLSHFFKKHCHLKGLIIIGRLAHDKSIQVLELAKQLGWPVLCDPQSGVSSDWHGYDVWLQNDEAQSRLSQCDVVVQFGARLVSKRLLQFLKQRVSDTSFTQYALSSNEAGILNPDHLPMLRFSGQWQQLEVLSSENNGWADELKHYAKRVTRETNTLLSSDITELEVAHRLHELTAGYQLFLGNSLGVRLLDMVSEHLDVTTYSNRGASGIDGIIATSAGVAAGNRQPTLTLIGDTSLLHDLNSLSLLAKQSSIVLLFNNDGGAIFDMLPVDESHKQSLYQMPHGHQFKHSAAQFNMHYHQPATWQELTQIVEDFNPTAGRSLMIEVVTPAGQASRHIKTLCSQIKGQ
ncbi:2-succinyl-5-enolpyruvyl-6-hydroxy-3-cyclohexene-1-carboxylic-acid synthase [Vibrio sp. UCD-FRSSP16_10]|uniref:2-succinyl-5-enolpyruvyl-6-hydroxy-3- cyclohexene-1-carboxylic-acid synthase n=1 Tax=unclassified Vibrio TaxID=2614977 RepID=UPI0007FDD8C6|nr:MULTISPECIES: 2-succinyl-5-enolpyruvyl-6-hydroxy-3-cyclohexene-1-carboxylic-acid synthase [unclassified Vibrio]OBT16036.1 2-succinyl-5-enolpyruvyl-6-hydroxy-3-cyclohexene-1-carboxylic-acid synthase [Vibrio sp. UCD-FRSSP16_30]OBT21118.1 2-succinyl-5-enolpyruvyl-6-hydroxy-3-cyclohexene-1-carboxylic-acid synthase [Vibrio sp. UCD-FRSSP16_10]